jgi:hypothetical protein
MDDAALLRSIDRTLKVFSVFCIAFALFVVLPVCWEIHRWLYVSPTDEAKLQKIHDEAEKIINAAPDAWNTPVTPSIRAKKLEERGDSKKGGKFD